MKANRVQSRYQRAIRYSEMKTDRSAGLYALGRWFLFRFHLLKVKAFRVEFRSDNLNLVNGLRGVTEVAGRAEAIRVRRRPQPHLVYSGVCQVEFHFIPCTILAQVEWHNPPPKRVRLALNINPLNCRTLSMKPEEDS